MNQRPTEDDSDLCAAKSRKTTLFKFRAYRTPQDKKWVHEILNDHRVYFARPSELNDPFDLNPRLQSADRETTLNAVDEYYARRHPDKEVERALAAEYFKRIDLPRHRAKATASMRASVEDAFQVFSLAGNRDHPMLWSHCADGHKGICIHFRSDARSIFGVTLRVDYRPERPILPIELGRLPEREVFEHVALQKGEFWHYEEEFRWLRVLKVENRGLPIRFDGRYGYFDPESLSGITLGARIPEAEAEALMRMAREHRPQLPVWRAIETDTFALEFVPVPLAPPESASTPG